ncbi:MAG: riboflavin kinase [Erysipelotrichaceae bacterium]
MEGEKNPFYEVKGTVIPGRGVGRQIGMPTANIKIEDEDRLPKPGVYISRIFLNGQTLYGVTHIGERPTFYDSKEISFETHILDYNKYIYGCEIQIQLFSKIRSTQKFDGAAALTEQIKKDCIAAREYWGLK